ncbi:hypothetical protein ABZ366_14630 [Streptomyces sp. NPDC005904]|uniref:hypothetical protein n=1 Tax=Streptomyces sp. NPDC005904 TaxID=3154570 RepID=UPI0033CCD189
MTVSWLALRGVLVTTLLTVLGTVASLGSAASLGSVPSGLVSYAAEAGPRGPVTSVDETPRAGSRPGEGRARPGRADAPIPDPPAPPSPPPDVSPPRPERVSVTLRDGMSDPKEPTSTESVLPGPRVLPLGGGLVLIGLGLGFLGLRLRRD